MARVDLWTGALCVVVVALALVGTASVSDDESALTATDLPAVILRGVPPMSPLETAGTGEAPTVDVRIQVTAAGRVGEVEVLGIHPSGEHDAAFATAVEEALSRWWFAPAIVDGKPTQASFDWSLEFRSLESHSSAGPPSSMPFSPAFGGGGDSASVRAALTALLRDEQPQWTRLLRIYSLPVEQQRRHLARLTEHAEESLSSEHRRVAESRWFRVVSDHSDEGFAEAVATNLEATVAVLADLLGQDIPLQMPPFKFVAYAYRSRAEYTGFLRSVDGIQETSGLFCPPGLIAFHAERTSSQELLATLIHEAVHAFLYGGVVRPGQAMPRWLNEGFADYVGNSAIRKGKLELGRHRAARFYRTPVSFYRGKTVQQIELESLKREIRRGDALTVSAIFNADRETFYGSEMGRFYAQSWMLVHFLRHGEEGWANDEFPRLVLYASEGYSLIDSLRVVYRLQPQDLEPRYREYIREF